MCEIRVHLGLNMSLQLVEMDTVPWILSAELTLSIVAIGVRCLSRRILELSNQHHLGASQNPSYWQKIQAAKKEKLHINIVILQVGDGDGEQRVRTQPLA